jgi:hypothetical protein
MDIKRVADSRYGMQQLDKAKGRDEREFVRTFECAGQDVFPLGPMISSERRSVWLVQSHSRKSIRSMSEIAGNHKRRDANMVLSSSPLKPWCHWISGCQSTEERERYPRDEIGLCGC